MEWARRGLSWMQKLNTLKPSSPRVEAAEACQTRTDHDYIKVALVGGVHEFLMCLIVGPFFSYGTFGNF